MKARFAISQYGGVHIDSIVHGASGTGLVVLLYDVLVDELTQAQILLTNRSYQACGERCARAITIIAGLRETLDFERGEPVSGKLLAFYNALTSKIMGAQVRRDPAWLGEALRLADSVREAWRSLEESRRHRTSPEVTATRRVDDLQSSAAASSGAGVAAVC